MRQVQPDLWETEPEYPAPGLSTHAYLLSIGEHRNLLIYNTTHAHELDHIERLGGLHAQYLSHQDEVAPSLRAIKDRFGSTLRAARADLDAVSAVSPVDVEFDERGVDDNGIEVVPAPGHSPGSTAFRYRSPHGRTYLFTGDTLYVDRDGEWSAGYIPGYSDAAPLRESILLLGGLAPDVVISSAFTGDAGVHEVDPAEWPALVDGAVRKLEAVRS
jgi:hydroxyacylglutathione hydrolase